MALVIPTINTTPAAAPARPKLVLDGIKKERLNKPPRLLLFGEGKVGKSTFAADAPEPVFVGAEDGTAELVTRRIPAPVDPVTGEHRWTWEHIRDAPLELAARPDLPYRTFVLDSVDWAEPLCWEWLCKKNNWHKGIEHPGYGKGYTAALEQWVQFLRNLDVLRDKCGYNIILIGHAIVKDFPNPDGESFPRYIIKMNEKAAGKIREWVDAVGFLRTELLTRSLENGRTERTIGVTTGKHILHLQNGATFEAGNRYDIRAPMYLPRPPHAWSTFFEAVEEGRPARRRERIAQAVARLAELLGDEAKPIAERVSQLVAEAGDESQRLGDILLGLNNKIEEVTKSKENSQ